MASIEWRMSTVHVLKGFKMLPCVLFNDSILFPICPLSDSPIHQFNAAKHHKAHFLQPFYECSSTFIWQGKRDLLLLFLDTLNTNSGWNHLKSIRRISTITFGMRHSWVFSPCSMLWTSNTLNFKRQIGWTYVFVIPLHFFNWAKQVFFFTG